MPIYPQQNSSQSQNPKQQPHNPPQKPQNSPKEPDYPSEEEIDNCKSKNSHENSSGEQNLENMNQTPKVNYHNLDDDNNYSSEQNLSAPPCLDQSSSEKNK